MPYRVILGDWHVLLVWPCNCSCPYVSVSRAVVNICGFCPMVLSSLDVCWGRSWVLTLLYLSVSKVARFVVAQRRAVITHFDCIFPPLANVYLWDFTFYFPNCHSASGRELFPASQPFPDEITPFFFFPQFSMWELNAGKFCPFFSFFLVVLELYSILIHFWCWYLISVTDVLHICSVLSVCNFCIA